jgi:hypothetical protein
MVVTRGRITYGVGNKNNPGDPWGHTELTIELDGRARLDQDALGGAFSWTGTVAASALESFWSALEEGGFPAVPEHPVPAGSATRILTIGADPRSPVVYIAYHAVSSWTNAASEHQVARGCRLDRRARYKHINDDAWRLLELGRKELSCRSASGGALQHTTQQH